MPSPSSEGAKFFGSDFLISIKLFFIRNYRRFIRFLISLSVISVFSISIFCVSVSAATSYRCVLAQPQLNGRNFYAEVITSNGWRWLIMGEVATNNLSCNDFYFVANSDGSNLWFTANIPLESITSDNVFFNAVYVDMESGVASQMSHTDFRTVYVSLGNSGKVVGIHGYGVDVSPFAGKVKSDFIINYGSDSVTLNNIEQILKSIQDNKSSAEKEQYSGATTEQKKAQSDLNVADKKITEDTAEARTTTINIFKNFSVVGDISKGLLSVTALFNDLCFRFSPSAGLLNFSLALGIGAFLLGVSAYLVSKVIHRGGK